jgi:hypothetical protein
MLGATMRLRPHRRNVVVWRQSAGSAGRYDLPPFTRSRGTSRVRGLIRACTLVPVMGLMQLERAVQSRWRPVLAGTVLTVAGLVLRAGPGGIVMLPGLMLLLYSPFLPANGEADRGRRRELERELAAYTTPAQRRDLEAALDRYPDSSTREIRDILHGLAVATGSSQLPGVRRCRG